MACSCASCAISFGVIFIVAGLVVNAISSVSPSSPYRDNPYFLQSREDFSSTPRLISIILMSIGAAFITISILFMILSLIACKKYQKQRINNNINTNPTEKEFVSQPTNNVKEQEVKMGSVKGDINTIGLPIYLPHNGFSYTAYPPVYLQKKNINPRNINFSKESQI